MACWCARRPSCQSRLPLSCPPGDPHGPPALYHFPWHRNIPTGLIELFSLMSLLFAVSTSRFSSSHRPHLSDPTIRVYLCDMAVTFSRPYNRLADPISIPPVGSPFLNFRRFTTALRTYPEKPTRLIFTHKSFGTSPSHSLRPYLSTPIQTRRMRSSGRNSTPLFWLSLGGYSWLGPVRRVRAPSSCTPAT